MRTSTTAVLLAVTLATAACGEDSERLGSPATPAPTSAPPSPTPATETSVSAYFLKGEKLQPVRRTAQGSDVAADAVRALLTGPSAAEKAAGLSSTVPAGTTLRSLAVKDGLATVDLSGSYDDGGGSLSMTARVAQVVFTLTRFPSVRQVTFRLEGQPVTALGGEGVDLREPVDRRDYEDLQPGVLMESPRWGETVSLPLRVAGSANVFEAVFFLELKDSAGKVVANTRVMATSGSGDRGTFDVTLTGTGAPGPGTLTAYTNSAQDGTRHDESSIPVVIGSA